MNIWWAPGQSNATTEVCRNLSWNEKLVLGGLTLLFGFCCFAFLAVLMDALAGFGPFHQYVEGFALPWLLAFGAGAWGTMSLQQNVLSRAARDKGYDLTEIKSTRPLSRGDCTALAGFAALAVTIPLIGFVIAV